VLLWWGENGKATAQDWPSLVKYVTAAMTLFPSILAGWGETRMAYNAASPDESALAQLDFDRAYTKSAFRSSGRLCLQFDFDREAILPADD